MPVWLRNCLRGIREAFSSTHRVYYRSYRVRIGAGSERPMTKDEERAVDLAFSKIDEAFKDLDRVFRDWSDR
jgi:hypothetical protein